ncbi:MAG: histidine triad nucleotide-binding protein [Chloroflexota bacterium]
MSDCLFCRIVNKEIPASIIHEDDDVLAFRDINPQAPVHFLVVPKRHIESLAAVVPGDERLLSRLVGAVNQVAEQEGLTAGGFRVVTNIGRDAGQTVPHLHFHILGGRSLTWPPG